jgi:branched-chain amino acid transport system ATP-binding protein
MTEALLVVEDVTVHYGKIAAVNGVSLMVNRGEIVGLIGPNGAGKSSTLNAIVGIVPMSGGSIRLTNLELRGRSPEEIVRFGIALVPEGRQIFHSLSVAENLALGASVRRDRSGVATDRDRLLERFPALTRYYHSSAAKLSGGEQQQLAIARALIARPDLLLLDEPSLGLAPQMVDLVFDFLRDLRHGEATILLVEQNVGRAVELADRTYVMRGGQILVSGTRDELVARTDFAEEYLGV